jgi:dihydroorotate dehydrogenase
VGTVTPFPQPGNEIPRLFRLPEDHALINRLGFNNDGLESLIEKLQVRKSHGILGINLGKNKDTPLEHAGEDYLRGLSATHAWADYFCINISSPNTEDLRQLQEGDQLSRLLEQLCSQREMLDREAGKKTPLLIKLAPDWEEEALQKSIERIKTFPLDGVVATNTTLSREGLTSPLSRESGGLSGKPLLKSSNKVIKTLYREIGAQIPIIGVGGIFTAEDAYAKIKAGASAVQIYTGLIYQGPGLVRELKKGLVRLLRQDGLPNITAAIGLDEKAAV